MLCEPNIRISISLASVSVCIQWMATLNRDSGSLRNATVRMRVAQTHARARVHTHTRIHCCGTDGAAEGRRTIPTAVGGFAWASRPQLRTCVCRRAGAHADAGFVGPAVAGGDPIANHGLESRPVLDSLRVTTPPPPLPRRRFSDTFNGSQTPSGPRYPSSPPPTGTHIACALPLFRSVAVRQHVPNAQPDAVTAPTRFIPSDSDDIEGAVHCPATEVLSGLDHRMNCRPDVVQIQKGC